MPSYLSMSDTGKQSPYNNLSLPVNRSIFSSGAGPIPKQVMVPSGICVKPRSTINAWGNPSWSAASSNSCKLLLVSNFNCDFALPLIQPGFPPFLMMYKRILSSRNRRVPCLRCNLAFTHLQIRCGTRGLACTQIHPFAFSRL